MENVKKGKWGRIDSRLSRMTGQNSSRGPLGLVFGRLRAQRQAPRERHVGSDRARTGTLRSPTGPGAAAPAREERLVRGREPGPAANPAGPPAAGAARRYPALSQRRRAEPAGRTMTSCRCPPRSIVTVRSSPIGAVSISACSITVPMTGRPATATIMSPGRSPASAAGVAAVTLAIKTEPRGPGRRGRRSIRRLDLHAQKGAANPAVRDQIGGDPASPVRRQRETHARNLGAPARLSRVDPHDFPGQIDERATGIERIDHGVGLEPFLG